MFVSPMYDNPAPAAAFHKEGWELYCSNTPLAAIAAPRGHAKSTAFTHTFGLAAALFRWESHIFVGSATEELAQLHLGDISKMLHESDDIKSEFGIVSFPVDAKGEIIVQCSDGYQFRFIARGTGQRIRGLKWNGRRPGLFLLDDMEEDEQVESADRRRKFGRWIGRALLPSGRRGARIRWHGTILHVDSYLAGIFKKKGSWKSLFYAAHAGFDDFSNILWPESVGEHDKVGPDGSVVEGLRTIRQRFIEDGDSPGYSQEYLNNPLDNGDAYLQRGWFTEATQEDLLRPKMHAVGVDFAISKQDHANRTSFTVGGLCEQNLLHFVDQKVGRFDALEIIEHFFQIHEDYRPDFFFVEKGQIWLSIYPILQKEMLKRGKFLNLIERLPVKDKASRGRALQRRMRAGGTRWPHDASWFPGMQDELLRFTGIGEATLDDQFDSAALLALGLEEMPDTEEEDFEDEDLKFIRTNDPRADLGRDEVTGY